MNQKKLKGEKILPALDVDKINAKQIYQEVYLSRKELDYDFDNLSLDEFLKKMFEKMLKDAFELMGNNQKDKQKRAEWEKIGSQTLGFANTIEFTRKSCIDDIKKHRKEILEKYNIDIEKMLKEFIGIGQYFMFFQHKPYSFFTDQILYRRAMQKNPRAKEYADALEYKYNNCSSTLSEKTKKNTAYDIFNPKHKGNANAPTKGTLRTYWKKYYPERFK